MWKNPGFGQKWGQARKSLWIETKMYDNPWAMFKGQARKSLWIETRLRT